MNLKLLNLLANDKEVGVSYFSVDPVAFVFLIENLYRLHAMQRGSNNHLLSWFDR
ncbi:MAG: hypothetical protein ACR2PI_16725 [Hyphomicrobiaceae bacterium]